MLNLIQYNSHMVLIASISTLVLGLSGRIILVYDFVFGRDGGGCLCLCGRGGGGTF